MSLAYNSSNTIKFCLHKLSAQRNKHIFKSATEGMSWKRNVCYQNFWLTSSYVLEKTTTFDNLQINMNKIFFCDPHFNILFCPVTERQTYFCPVFNFFRPYFFGIFIFSLQFNWQIGFCANDGMIRGSLVSDATAKPSTPQPLSPSIKVIRYVFPNQVLLLWPWYFGNLGPLTDQTCN